jgi:hypothetical protein
MKKPIPRLSKKLVVTRETLRSLAHLELAQAVGGLFDTGDVDCPAKAPLLADTGAEMCTDQAAPKPPRG